jgi:uncharacterized protein YqhQ
MAQSEELNENQEEQENELEKKKQEKYRVGVTVLMLLAVLTIGEFGLSAVGANAAFILVPIALIKAFFVIRDYMHVGRLITDTEKVL